MPAPKPVKLTQVTTGSYTGPAPQPLVIVGTLPAAAITKAAHVAPVTPATDGTTAGTALNAVIASLIAAGLMASS